MRWWHTSCLPKPSYPDDPRHLRIPAGLLARAPRGDSRPELHTLCSPSHRGSPRRANFARPERSDRRLPLVIATSFIGLLRRPIESALCTEIQIRVATRLEQIRADDRVDLAVTLRAVPAVRSTSEQMAATIGGGPTPSSPMPYWSYFRARTAKMAPRHGSSSRSAERDIVNPTKQHITAHANSQGNHQVLS